MTTFIIYFLYFVGVVIGWVLLYYVVKSAVKNGIKEARVDTEFPTYIMDNKPEIQSNSEQRKLQQRYDKGEIPFEVFQSEWNKLNS
jgi:hypothetical protein